MATITTRAGKGAPLTNTELDANFNNLNAGLTTNAAITGGSIDGTAVGATTRSTGAFTNLSASGTFELTGDQVQVSEGGTGASTAAAAKVNLEVVTGATGSARLPAGTTLQRDVTPANGFVRFNTTTGVFEGYNGTTWTALSQPTGIDIVTTTGAQSVSDKTLVNPLLSLGGTNGTAGQVPVSQGAGLPPVWAEGGGKTPDYVFLALGVL